VLAAARSPMDGPSLPPGSWPSGSLDSVMSRAHSPALALQQVHTSNVPRDRRRSDTTVPIGAPEQPDRDPSPENNKGHGSHTRRPRPPGQPHAPAGRQHDGDGVAGPQCLRLGLYLDVATTGRIAKTDHRQAVLATAPQAGGALVDVVLGKALHTP
jgi:hypothetical protein